MAKVSKSLIKEVLDSRLVKVPFNLLDPNFIKQNNFINDPIKRKALWCTRRAAKSYTGGLYMVKEAYETPGVNILYIGLTRASAEGICWKDILKVIDKKHNLNIKFNETKLTATLPNGSVIWLAGVDTKPDEMDKLLGKKYKLVILDESSLYSIDLRRLCYGILGPALIDQNGTLCMLGTSSDIIQGLFFDITQGIEAGWSVHSWTAMDNPYIAEQWKLELDDIKQNRPLFMETNLYKQWYLNQWVIDESKMVYKFNNQRNLYNYLPHYNSGSWTYTLGVDLGHSPDPSAFVVSAFHEYDRVLYIIDTFAKLEMDITDVANKIKYFTKLYPIYKTMIDGANKQAVAEMQKRHDLSLKNADKTGKSHFINLMNADFIQGYIKVNPNTCNELIDEYNKLTWKVKGGTIAIPREEKAGLANHLCDAALYNWRECYQFLSTKEPVKINLVQEWAKIAEQSLYEAMEKEEERKQQDDRTLDFETIDNMDPFNSYEQNATRYYLDKRKSG